MAALEGLGPTKVFTYFEQLCSIPHGSGNTKAISDYLCAFAEKRKLKYYQDELNNVIIYAPASAGYENAKTVIIQGHMDMVCEKAADCEKDMAVEGLDLAVDGDRIFARGTTLGGDDGIAVAMALAVLDDPSLPHPALEVLITVDEETGMDGAMGLDMSKISGRMLLNLDSEEEGIFTVGCAGGIGSCCTLPVRRESFEGSVLEFKVHGLLGGHSGAQIDTGRANSNKLMARLLSALSASQPARLISVAGGLKDNAIPVETRALVAVKDEEKAKAITAEMQSTFRREYRGIEENICLSAEKCGSELLPMDESSFKKTLCLLLCSPNGVQTMSADIAGLVQTSLNMGIVSTDESSVTVRFNIRSSVGSQKLMLAESIRLLAETLGAGVIESGDYPGWDYRPDSPLRELLVDVFKRQYGHAPKVEAIHAGLECGLFIGKCPELDCISFGPTIDDIHTPRETLYVGSTQRTWKLLTEALKEMK